MQVEILPIRQWADTCLQIGQILSQPDLRGGKVSSLSAAMLESVRTELAQGTRTWTAAQVADRVAAEHGVRLSADRIRIHLRRARISWQRTSRTLRHKQDPAEVAEREAVLTDPAKKGMQG
jgi:transposase